MDICYLIAFPDSENEETPPPEQFRGLIKDAPYFQPVDIDLVTMGEETIVIEGFAISIMRHRYDGRVQMIECRYGLDDPFAASVLQTRAKIQNALQSRFIPSTSSKRIVRRIYDTPCKRGASHAGQVDREKRAGAVEFHPLATRCVRQFGNE